MEEQKRVLPKKKGKNYHLTSIVLNTFSRLKPPKLSSFSHVHFNQPNGYFSSHPSVLLPAHSRHASSVQIRGVVWVHGRMNSHVLHVLQILALHERIRWACHHLAHIIRLLTQQLVRLASPCKITAFLAPESARIVPFKGFLAGSVAHATVIISVMGKSSWHYFYDF